MEMDTGMCLVVQIIFVNYYTQKCTRIRCTFFLSLFLSFFLSPWRLLFSGFVMQCSPEEYDNNFMLLFARRCLYSTQEYRRKIHFCTSHPELSISFSPSIAPARRTIRRDLPISKASAKPCFQWYFAAAGVIFQWYRRGRVRRIFLACEKSAASRRKWRDAS